MVLSSKSRSYLLLGICAAVITGTVVLSAAWSIDLLTDHSVWTKRAQHLIDDYANGLHGIAQSRYSGHPGMVALQVSTVISGIFQIPAERAIVAATALLVSLAATGIGYVAYRTSNQTFWWIPSALTALLHPLYLQASPTNALFAPYTVLFLLLAHYIAHRKPASQAWTVLLGIVWGVMLATRMSEALFFGVATLGYLMLFVSIRRLAIVTAIAALSTVVLNPLLLFLPVEHVLHIFGRTKLHVRELEEGLTRPVDFLLYAPLALISIGLSIAALAVKSLKLPIARSFITFSLLLSLVFGTLLFTANVSSLRYFFPLFLWWEILLAPVILAAIYNIQWPFPFITPQRAELVTVVLLVSIPILLLGYALATPVAGWEQQLSSLLSLHLGVKS